MKKYSRPDNWLDSKDVRAELEISACDLAHFRETGKLTYQKEARSCMERRR
jgi:hypothetical protein